MISAHETQNKDFSDTITQIIATFSTQNHASFWVYGESEHHDNSEWLYLKEMNHHLLSPFIIKLAGIEVNKQLKFMTTNPTTKHQSIYLPSDDLRLLLLIKGILSYLPTRKSSHEEYLNQETRLELTPPFSEWNSHNLSYGISENCMLDHNDNIATVRNLAMDVDATVGNISEKITQEVGVGSIMTAILPTLES